MSVSNAAELAESPFELVVEMCRVVVGEVDVATVDCVMETCEKTGEMPVEEDEAAAYERGGEAKVRGGEFFA